MATAENHDARSISVSSGSEALDRAEQALKTGRFAAARTLLAAARPTTDADQQRARALWARLAPDPLAIGLVAACLVLFVALIKIYAH